MPTTTSNEADANPFSWEALIRWALRPRNRRRAIWPVAVLILAYGWAHWPTIKTLPFVTQVAGGIDSRLRQYAPIPQHDENKVSVAVLSLENDNDGATRQRILDSLNNLWAAISVVRLRQIITTENPSDGEKEAREILERSHFDVIIYGSASQIFWVTSAKLPQKRTTNITPEVLDPDLSDILKLAVTTSVARVVDSGQGQYIAEKLEPLIASTRLLVDDTKAFHDQTARGQLSMSLADALVVHGDQVNSKADLVEAIDRFKSASSVFKRARNDDQYSEAQNRLGNAYVILGETEPGAGDLNKAIGAYNNAFTIRRRYNKSNPNDFTSTEDGMATAYERRAEHEAAINDKQMFTDFGTAITYYKDALDKRGGRDYAATEDALGTAYERRGEHTGISDLKLAIKKYEDVLHRRERASGARDWAWTKNNIGIAYEKLSERMTDTASPQYLTAAIHSYQDALCERNTPGEREETQNNLEIAERRLKLWNESKAGNLPKEAPQQDCVTAGTPQDSN